MRSTFRSPVSLSSSYLTLDPLGISIRAVNSSGASSPIGTSCQGWGILVTPFGEGDSTGGPRSYYMGQRCDWQGRLLAEFFQDGLVGLLLGQQYLRAVVEVGRVALQLRARHLAFSAVQHQ